MGTQVTLTLPEDLYEHAGRWAVLTRRDMSQVLIEALEIALTPTHTSPGLETPVSSLPDEEVLAASQAKMEPAQGQRLSRLLEKQREGLLVDDERSELLALMQLYEQLWVRQSEALAEAVRRGLREPLEP